MKYRKPAAGSVSVSRSNAPPSVSQMAACFAKVTKARNPYPTSTYLLTQRSDRASRVAAIPRQVKP